MKRKPLIISMLLFFSFVGLLFYFGVRIYIFFSGQYGFINFAISFLLILAETHSIVHSLGFVIGLVRLRKPNPNYHRHANLDKNNLVPWKLNDYEIEVKK